MCRDGAGTGAPPPPPAPPGRPPPAAPPPGGPRRDEQSPCSHLSSHAGEIPIARQLTACGTPCWSLWAAMKAATLTGAKSAPWRLRKLAHAGEALASGVPGGHPPWKE